MTADEPRAVSIIVAGDVYEVGAAFIKAAVDECGYLVFDLRDIDVGFAQTGRARIVRRALCPPGRSIVVCDRPGRSTVACDPHGIACRSSLRESSGIPMGSFLDHRLSCVTSDALPVSETTLETTLETTPENAGV